MEAAVSDAVESKSVNFSNKVLLNIRNISQYNINRNYTLQPS